MPTNTIAKAPAASRLQPRVLARFRTPAGRAAGRRPENSGSFWPRTRLFMRSIAVTPVSMKSRGSARCRRVHRAAVDAQPALAP